MFETVLVVDCGATSITVAAVDEQGHIVSATTRENRPASQPGGEAGWLIWDMKRLWATVCTAMRDTVRDVPMAKLSAVAVATWGADGAPVTESGELTYPAIAWQCPRNWQAASRLAGKFDPRWLFDRTGYQVIGFNTLFKLGWLRENAPEALEKADKWLMMPGLLSQRLCGETNLDVTSASTMMMLDLQKREWCPELLDAVGVDASLFPDLTYPGRVIGELRPEVARQTGLEPGIPVVAAGHDTQFAPIGSGAEADDAIVSTATWEIAMLRTDAPAAGEYAFEQGVLTEADAVPEVYNPQLLMMGSGTLEWVRESLFGTEEDASSEDLLVAAAGVPEGAGGVMFVPSLVPDTGPSRRHRTAGTLVGLRLGTSRAQIYRAALEGLCFQLRQAVGILSEATGFRPERLRVVGEGARNPLWNQLRADVCGMPVVVNEHKEATVVGTAVAAWVGAGRFDSIEAGMHELTRETEVFEPSAQSGKYDSMFEDYIRIAPSLSEFYSQ